ncbi:hypothetical protein AZI86_14255 [Bdellovibrio bacteriovorus]|uniref:Secreted protein n=1 Tax=Bdellovibrio bacteriovorus TaxID=959 RepID=A0A150WJM6_BDEBC|nr:hypothetical protein [Bdellovibrio bacteriovorus]KYG63968.1 hypothetical protein AZI86_14255 [Bdellovibrio bacteriovorus]
MKTLLATLMLISVSAYAAPQATGPQRTEVLSESGTKAVGKDKVNEPSAIPCPPQETRTDKLDKLAKLEGAGESHSTNCPTQGVIKEAPDAVPSKKVE